MGDMRILLEDIFLTGGSQIVVESERRDAYIKFFRSKLEKYNVDSPTQLSEEKKKKFFDEISSEWTEKKDTED